MKKKRLITYISLFALIFSLVLEPVSNMTSVLAAQELTTTSSSSEVDEETEGSSEETTQGEQANVPDEGAGVDPTGPTDESQSAGTDQIAPAAEVSENLLTDFSLSYSVKEGALIPVPNGSDLSVVPDDMNAVQIIYTLVKPNDVDLSPGDTYTLDLPEIYGEGGAATNIPIVVDGIEVATYSIVDDQVIITFTEHANSFDDAEMHVNITGSFDKTVFETMEEVEIEVPYRVGTSFTATIKAEPHDFVGEDKKTAGKPYILDGDSKVETDRNPTHIDWTVRVNDNMDNYTTAIVEDTLGDGLEIVEGSFVVERIKRNYKGEEILPRETIEGLTPQISGSGFTLDLGSIEDAYEITYTTKVTRPEGGGTHTINNKAKITLDDTPNDVTDSFTGTWSGDIPVIEKTGNSTDDPHVIDWQVEYNYGKENLGVVSLTDELSHGEIDLSTINVYQVNTDVDGNIVGDRIPITITPVEDADGNVTFLGLEADGKAYYITFSSTVPVGLNNVTVTNTITDDLEQPNSDDATVNVNTIPKGGKVGEQEVDENGNPYIEWTITMNSNKVDVGSITVRDVFNQDFLEFDTKDDSLFELILVTAGGDVEVDYDKFSIEPYTHDEDGHPADGYEGFELNISDAGPHEYKFVYRTYYTVAGMQEPKLANHALLVFKDGEGEGIGEPVDVEYGLTGPKAGIHKHGNYVTNEENTEQEIEWTLNVNDSKILLKEGSTITEEFTSGNYTYIAGSLTATKEDGTTLAHDLAVEADNMGFVLTLTEETNEKFTIKFRTTVDDTNNLNHDNKATLTWDGMTEEASATVHKRDAGLNKHGYVVINEDGSKTVKWTIDFNTSKNVLHDFKLTDTYTPSTVTVSDIKITADGVDVTSEFTVSDPAEGTFTVEKDRLDAVQYQLTYSTTLSPTEEQAEIKNTADITYIGGTDNKHHTIQSPTLRVEKQANSIINEEGQDNPHISWTIKANTENWTGYVNLVDAVLTDTIPADQKLVAGSIKVTKINRDWSEESITDQIDIVEEDNAFSIPLPDGPYQYRVEFETEILQMPSLDADVFDRYNNSTTLTSSPEGIEPLEDSADAWIRYFERQANNLTSKTGEQNPDTENIDYEVTINPEGLTIHNVKIKDTLSTHHQYIGLVEDGTTLPIDESIIITDAARNQLIKDEDYVITLGEGNRSFEISFVTDANPEGIINSSHTITYSTRLNAHLVGNYTVTNNIVITGGTNDKELNRTSTSTDTQQWFYGGGGSGKVLDFVIGKEKPSGEQLSGVVFKLERTNINGNLTTVDEELIINGESIDLSKYRAGRYKLTETQTPEGYEGIEPIYFEVGYTETEGVYQIIILGPNWQKSEHDNASAEGNVLTVVNEYTPVTAEPFEVSKKLVISPNLGDLDLDADQFEFELLDSNGIVVTRAKNDSEGNVKFEAQSFDEPGAYNFTIREVNGHRAGITYDTSEFDIVVEVVEGDAGLEVESVTYPETPMVFTNLYTASGSWRPEVSKVLTAGGRELIAGEFDFEISGIPLPDGYTTTATNDADGKVVFGEINFTQEDIGKTYTYTVVEKAGSETNMEYDSETVTISVLVEDGKNGNLTFTPTYPDGREFNNSYTASGSWIPEVSKVLSAGSRLLKAGEFDFEISGTPLPDGYTTTVSNDADGNVVFGEISYTQEDIGKTYTYTIKELAGNEAGMGYDDMEVEITVEVVDAGNGVLTVTPTYPDDTEFNNIYTASGSWIPEVSKVLTAGGRVLRDGEFSFEISLGDDVVGTATNDADGKVVFEEISYTPEDIGKTYTYTIVEVDDSETGMDYDDMEVEITVTVADAGDGELTITPTYSEDTEFNNSYTASGSWSPEVSKVLTAGSRVLRDGEFSFTISGTPLPDGYTTTATNDVDGKVEFEEINFTQEDIGKTYTYTVVEVVGSEAGMDYDSNTVTISVLVEDNTNGELTFTTTYPDGREFNNSYTASGSWTPEVSKVLTAGGRVLRDGEFSFAIFLGDDVVGTATNDADGKVVFEEISYTPEDIGKTYTYTIVEVDDSETGMDYDDMEVEITVTVVDAGGGVLTVTPTYPEDTEFNNIYEASGSWIPEVSKVLTAGGRDLTAGEFSFEIDGPGLADDYTTTVSNDADGKVVFGQISYTQEDIGKTYTYTIVEVRGSESGMDYDDMEVEITVTVLDAGNGELTITPTYPDDTEFNNIYTASGSWIPEVSKVLTAGGRLLTAGEFDFEISGTPIPDGYTTTVSNDADGKVVFGEISYTQEDIGKTYTYTVVEVPGSEAGMDYDDMEVEITVTVVDAGNGVLTVTPTYPDDTEFNNSYTANGSWTPEVSKVLAAGTRLLTAGEFSFEISGPGLADDYTTTVSNDADGKVVFGEISYTQADIGKTYTYTIVEITGSETGMDYDDMEIEITVTVVDAGNGVLTVTPTYPEDTEFNNTYTASGSWIPTATKNLLGRDINDGEFAFEIILGDDVVGTATNDAEGNVVFDEIFYTEEDIDQTYIYTITEVLGELGGVTYDSAEFQVSVSITDAGNGELTVSVEHLDGDIIFNNTYTAQPVDVELLASKILESQYLQAGQFTFELLEIDGDLQETVTNNIDGEIVFGVITYDEIGVYHYTIRELVGEQYGITYDDTTYTVVVTVTDNGLGNLLAEIEYVGVDEVVFTNTYIPDPDSVVIEASKTLEGQDLREGQFEFELVDSAGEVLQTVTNNAQGQIIFDEITYESIHGLDGVFTYTIREVEGSQGGVDYDTAVYEVVVTVTDDGVGTLTAVLDYVDGPIEFTNTYQAAPTDATITVGKELTGGKALEAGQFTFHLLQDGEVIAVTTNTADGRVIFDAIEYTETGTYSYIVKELAVANDGFAYDPAEFEITVVITDDAEGQLLADVIYPEDIVFNNRYKKVSVGDYVWIDENKDGLQDDTDIPVEGVVLEITDSEGNPVTDVYGNPVGPVTTDENGYYIFDNLPADKAYIVRINREQSAEALKGYVPTIETTGNREIDSSTWIAHSVFLPNDGDHDPTLDFGFVVDPDIEFLDEDDDKPGEGAGSTGESATRVFALVVVFLALALVLEIRRRSNEA